MALKLYIGFGIEPFTDPWKSHVWYCVTYRASRIAYHVSRIAYCVLRIAYGRFVVVNGAAGAAAAYCGQERAACTKQVGLHAGQARDRDPIGGESDRRQVTHS